MYLRLLILFATLGSSLTSYSGWNSSPNTQYHIQTDEGPERYFKYQTQSGQYRKEKRLQDGTVIGSYGWVDADGILRLRDYIADNLGYRILKSKTIYVGPQRPIQDAVAIAKHVPAQAGILVDAGGVRNPVSTTPQPPAATTYRPSSLTPPSRRFPSFIPSSTIPPYSSTPVVFISPNSIESSSEKPFYNYRTVSPSVPSSTAASYPVTTYRPAFRIIANSVNDYDDNYRSDTYNNGRIIKPYSSNNFHLDANSNQFTPIDRKDSLEANTVANSVKYTPQIYQNANYGSNGYRANQLGNGYDPQFPLYDGVSVTKNGFRYYLPKQYHEEESSDGNTRTGSFGYVDPFGIRRVIYYNTAPGTGFQLRKNNRYVGHNATPYDPRPI